MHKVNNFQHLEKIWHTRISGARRAPFEILAPAGGFLHSYEEDGGNMGKGANLYIKHELIDCIPVYHALYSHFDTFKLIERNAY